MSGTNPIHIRRSRPDDADRLFAIWDRAVAATHDFLDPQDRREIARIVRDVYLPATSFWVATDAGRVVAFMGLSEAHVDALFVDPESHGRGIGRRLIAHAATFAPILTVDVNEQNDRAIGFYERLGFRATGRSERDGLGMPYALVHMRKVS